MWLQALWPFLFRFHMHSGPKVQAVNMKMIGAAAPPIIDKAKHSAANGRNDSLRASNPGGITETTVKLVLARNKPNVAATP